MFLIGWDEQTARSCLGTHRYSRRSPREVGAAEETEIVGLLDQLWNAVGEVEFSDLTRSAADAEGTRTHAQAIAPVVWLLGKTGAGKTAIVAALTGNPRAAVGEGFEACTQTAAFYDVPREVPLLRFLDTRGLGEADYDPAQDIAWCEDHSHLVHCIWHGPTSRTTASGRKPDR
jgi:hypothetical protein